jgi:hypothetical protein
MNVSDIYSSTLAFNLPNFSLHKKAAGFSKSQPPFF